MKPDRFARVKDLLLAAAELSESDRQAYLDDACKDDPELRREVEAILAHDGESGPLKTADAPTRVAHHVSDHIAGYRILQKLGEGGMGTVYEAEQTEPIRRRLALKVIKLGMDTRQVVARFEAERQALAMMDHPHIAKVFDAGVTEDGRPYFAMEHVSGVSITDYCDRHQLPTETRLRLFAQVCDAVQHAHQKGIIHRDIKPSNVLVAVTGGEPVPKVIDFGVAKAIAQPLTERTLFTEHGQLIGTPDYMSPEQAEMTGLNIDTRTDIYSLGVLLYELLVGALPFDRTTLREAGFSGLQRILREEEPPRPSTRLTSLGDDSAVVARKRQTDRAKLLSQLRGDLDWVTMKALEKDRTRRYAAASEFAADVERYLHHQPVLARPPSAVYRMRKYVRRHRVGVGVAAAAVLGVILAFVLVTVQNARIAKARDEAVLAITSLEEMLTSVDPTKSGRDVTVRETLDETANTLGNKFKAQPLVEARLRHTVGKTYDALGEYDDAERHLQRAVEIRRELLGEEDPATLESSNDLASVYVHQRHYHEAEALVRETLEIRGRVLGAEHPQTLASMQVLAEAYQGQRGDDEAEALYQEALEIQRRVLGEEDPATLESSAGLAAVYARQGRYDEAEALHREVLEIRRRVLGEKHPGTLKSMNDLAITYRSQGRYDEAEAVLRETLEIRRRVLGEEHLSTLSSINALAITYRSQGRYDEAEALLRDTLEIQRRVLGEGHRATLQSMVNLAAFYKHDGRYDEAEAVCQKSLEISRRVHGEEHRTTNKQRFNLACVTALQGRRDEAISILWEAVHNGFRGPPCCPSIHDDPDLASLRGDPEFEAIAEELRRRNEEGATAEGTAGSE